MLARAWGAGAEICTGWPWTVALGMLRPSVCAGKGQGGLLGLKCWGTCWEWDLRRVFQGRKHFKHLGFQEIMLKLEPQGYPLPPKPIAQARLPELRVGKALTICLSAHEGAPEASLAGLGQASGWSPCPARGFVLHPLPSSPGLGPVTKATSTGPLVSEFQVMMFPHPSLGAEPTRW